MASQQQRADRDEEVVRVSVQGHPRAGELPAWRTLCLDRKETSRAPSRYFQERRCNLQVTSYVWKYWQDINTPGREAETMLPTGTHLQQNKSKYDAFFKSRKTKMNLLIEKLLSQHSMRLSRGKIHIIIGKYTLNIDLTKHYNYTERMREGKSVHV